MAKTKREHRPARAAQRVREELARLLGQELGDPRLSAVLISHVEMTEDLSLARVLFVVTDGAEATAKGAMVVLRKLEPMLRAKLAPRLAMRRVPALRFEPDTNREETAKLERLLHEVGEDLKARPEEPSAPEEPAVPPEGAASPAPDAAPEG
ncbi:MAG: 30S ribosome-binding factor RbfA [Deltaproteobacteria bacterium]|nr:30S ribosome-binding factor RbfA [Deltaproteobacteria bacterium]